MKRHEEGNRTGVGDRHAFLVNFALTSPTIFFLFIEMAL